MSVVYYRKMAMITAVKL